MYLSERILTLGQTFLELSELEKLCEFEQYSEFAESVKNLIYDGIIKPVGNAATNGMFPPLKTRYRICRKKEDNSEIIEEIMKLEPDYEPSKYLSKIELYKKHRDLLHNLRTYVRERGTQLKEIMSKNERAYAIWGNEKILDSTECKSMLKFIGWEDKLNYYKTPEPFFEYLCNGANSENILVLENKDIWFSLRKLFMETPGRVLFDQKFDGLLYGEGKRITRDGAFEDSSGSFCKPPQFFYWGDLDYEGIGIFQGISHHSVHLFAPGYLEMLKLVKGNIPYGKQHKPLSDMSKFLAYFDEPATREIKNILENDAYIPQEICNYQTLKAALKVGM